MILNVEHITKFVYPSNVSSSFNEVRMTPLETPHQKVLSHSLDITPCDFVNKYTDYWGTDVTYYEMQGYHNSMTITANSVVELFSEINPTYTPETTWNWEQMDNICALEDKKLLWELTEQLLPLKRLTPPKELLDLAKRLKEKAVADGVNPHNFAISLCLAIRDEIEYQPGSTNVRTTVKNAWENRKGVCQDISHICLSALRSLGIPARYISGYLAPGGHIDIGETLVGQSHAWIEFYTGHSWYAFDPTNRQDAHNQHVAVAKGRSYLDVTPFRGVYQGNGDAELDVSVNIIRKK
jgi:transglutaminase-like putative cysteine protease